MIDYKRQSEVKVDPSSTVTKHPTTEACLPLISKVPFVRYGDCCSNFTSCRPVIQTKPNKQCAGNFHRARDSFPFEKYRIQIQMIVIFRVTSHFSRAEIISRIS